MANDTDHTGLIVSRVLVCSVGIVANLLVVLVFVYNNIFRKSLSHTLILHQSIIDFNGCCLFLGFYNNDAPPGHAGTVFCKFRVLFWYMSATSIYNLVMLTIERYMAVIHPIMYRRRQLGGRRGVPLVASHVLGALSSLQLLFLAESKPDSPGECMYNYGSVGVRVFSGILLFTTYWLIPVSIMGYCYTNIYKSMRSRSPSSDESGGAVHKAQKNLLATLWIVCIAFLLTVTPNFTLYLVYCICNCFEFSEITLHEVTVLLNTMNLCINPFIYSFKFNDFQIGILKLKRDILNYIRGEKPETRAEAEMARLEKSSSVGTI